MLLSAPARAQAQTAGHTGTIEQNSKTLKWTLPAVQFNFLEGTVVWSCKGGTPDDMRFGGWNGDRLQGAGNVTIKAKPTGNNTFSVISLTTQDGNTLPELPVKKAAPAVVCKRR
jgi:hypothetical protein